MNEDEIEGSLREVLGVDPTFGHRQHVHLAWRYSRDAELAVAEHRMCAAIRYVAALHRTPEKYHETLTMFWTRLVAAHVTTSDVRSFDEFIAKNAALLDRRLPARHYSDRVLMSDQARQEWVEPDLCPLP